MKYLKIMLLIIISYILQGTVLASVSFFNVVPDLVVVCIICFSLYEDSWFCAAVVGFISGLILDTSGGAVMGLNAILCMYTAIICSILSKKIFRGKFFVSIIFVFIISFFYESLLYIFGFELWRDANIIYCILNVILPVSIYNSLIAAIIYTPVKKIIEITE